MEEERKVNRLLRDDPENDKLNDRLQQVHASFCLTVAPHSGVRWSMCMAAPHPPNTHGTPSLPRGENAETHCCYFYT